MPFQPAYPGEFPSLGREVLQWVEAYLRIPDGDLRGQPFVFTRSQAEFFIKLFRVSEHYALSTFYRRAARIGSKSTGKSPTGAVLALAAIGAPIKPAGYDANGRPVGRPFPSPVVQIAGVSEEQAGNVYDLLADMVGHDGPLHDALPYLDIGKTRISLEGRDVIMPVSSNGSARSGQRVTFGICEEALALDTRVPMPNGWSTVGEVKAGDVIYDRHGRPTRVVKTTEVFHGRPCYRVTFADGTSVVADEGHLWQTRITGSGAKPQVRRTMDLVQPPAAKSRWQVPISAPVERDDADLLLDPYMLGYWLGDGDSTAATLAVGAQDIEATWAELERRGITVVLSKDKHDRSKRLCLTVAGAQRGRYPTHGAILSVSTRLKSLGVLGNKHIPEQYLLSSVQQRLDLLRGLMDSDGSITPQGFCCFAQNRRVIVDQVVELLRSLGQRPRVSWNADAKSRQGGCWKVQFTPRDIQPFNLPRKAARVRPTHTDKGLSIVTVEPVPSVPVKCIEVDNDEHLFLTGDFLVTHNTQEWRKGNGGHKLFNMIRANTEKTSGMCVELSNAPEPGENSVAERTITAFRQGGEGAEGVYLDMKQPSKAWDWSVREERRAHLVEVYGDTAQENGGWVDLDRILAGTYDASYDLSFVKRMFGNVMAAGQGAWIDVSEWNDCIDKVKLVQPGEMIAMGFDGARTGDSTVLRGCRIDDGHLFTIGIWERDPHLEPDEPWEVPQHEVMSAVTMAMSTYTVLRFYADPPYWRDEVDKWAAEWPDVVVGWNTNRDTPMAAALERLHTAITQGTLTHDDDSAVSQHYGNVFKMVRGSAEKPLVLVKKESPTSKRKIDAVVTDALAYEARWDAITAGLPQPKPANYYTAYEL